MDLNTVAEVRDAAALDRWRPGDAWLAGGTYLFSEPQPGVTRLLDLASFNWAPLTATDNGLEIAATCTVAELFGFEPPVRWPALQPLIQQCCHAFLASFKIWNVATVGGNLCNALPAGPMISLTAALDGVCTVLTVDGRTRLMPVTELVTGAGTIALAPGDLLRSVTLPGTALGGTTAFRQGSLNTHGRSAALLIGRRDPSGALVLTVTASTVRPVRLSFPTIPDAAMLRAAITATIPDDAYVDDVHGLPEWRRHLTLLFAEEIRRELA
ncbi:FAD binding domain-containing protein [Luedemannella flava]|uniref:FAD binding domain-containing protein n=1 Tax=Luedemannella flava TaxID=349316 RepID=A0ABN2MBC4_9ACTN